MNRVLEVDDELAYAVVEPGVRFFDLYDHLQAGGFPGCGRRSRPRLGQRLSATRSTTAAAIPCTATTRRLNVLEVVLANGKLLRTGMGGMTGSKTWHSSTESLDLAPGLFSQSNFGIVTKMGVWLMRAPEVYLAGRATWKTDMAPGYRCHARADVRRGRPELPARRLRDPERGRLLPKELGWTLRYALYGREVQRRSTRWPATRSASIPGLEVGRPHVPGDERTRATIHDDKVNGGVPGMELMDMFKQQFGDEFGTSICPPSGRCRERTWSTRSGFAAS